MSFSVSADISGDPVKMSPMQVQGFLLAGGVVRSVFAFGFGGLYGYFAHIPFWKPGLLCVMSELVSTAFQMILRGFQQGIGFGEHTYQIINLAGAVLCVTAFLISGLALGILEPYGAVALGSILLLAAGIRFGTFLLKK